MLGTLITCLKGTYIIRAEGRFPERILNIASTSGIYVQKVRREDENTISFHTGKKGGEKILEAKLEGLTLTLSESYGLPVFLKKHRRRFFLYALPAFFLAASFVFSLFIWKVEIEGGDEKLRKDVLSVISREGVHKGALKYKIDKYKIKRNAILETDNLSWMWVDIKGTTAKVKVRPRTPVPDVIPINEPSDVVASHSGIIEKMQVYCGVPLVKEGDFVKKGQIIITGIFRSENENIPTYYHHATGNVVVRLFKEKTVVIPRKTLKKNPTGNKKSVYSINFEKNNVNFSLNSRISYSEYDKIEKKYSLPLTGISFSKTDYYENDVVSVETDVKAESEKRRKEFLDSLSEKKMETISLTEDIEEKDDSVRITFGAECLVRTDKEIPVSENIQDEEVNSDGENS